MNNQDDIRGYARVKKAAEYLNISVRTMRSLLKKGLPHYRLNNKTILIAYKDMDAWMQQFKADQNEIGQMVDDILKEF